MPESLLRRGDKILVSTQGKFAAREGFRVSLDPGATVLIAYVTDGFARHFLDKLEEPVPEVSLVWYELQGNAGNQAIVADLGGATQVETALGVVFALLLRQGHGKPGPLANNGWGNAFYVRDVSGDLRSVYVHWCDEGWGVDSTPIVSNLEWPIRDRVFVPFHPAFSE
jgi:hypothetical protein